MGGGTGGVSRSRGVGSEGGGAVGNVGGPGTIVAQLYECRRSSDYPKEGLIFERRFRKFYDVYTACGYVLGRKMVISRLEGVN